MCFTSLICTSFIGVPSLVCVDLKYFNWSTSSTVFPFIHILVDGLGLTLLTRVFAFVRTNFPTVSSSCFLHLFSELLELNVIRKLQVAKRLFFDGLVLGITLICLHQVIYLSHPGANDLGCWGAVKQQLYLSILRWTLATVGCQFRLHLLLHHLQNSRSPIYDEVPTPSALSFPGIY